MLCWSGGLNRTPTRQPGESFLAAAELWRLKGNQIPGIRKPNKERNQKKKNKESEWQSGQSSEAPTTTQATRANFNISRNWTEQKQHKNKYKSFQIRKVTKQQQRKKVIRRNDDYILLKHLKTHTHVIIVFQSTRRSHQIHLSNARCESSTIVPEFREFRFVNAKRRMNGRMVRQTDFHFLTFYFYFYCLFPIILLCFKSLRSRVWTVSHAKHPWRQHGNFFDCLMPFPISARQGENVVDARGIFHYNLWLSLEELRKRLSSYSIVLDLTGTETSTSSWVVENIIMLMEYDVMTERCVWDVRC